MPLTDRGLTARVHAALDAAAQHTERVIRYGLEDAVAAIDAAGRAPSSACEVYQFEPSGYFPIGQHIACEERQCSVCGQPWPCLTVSLAAELHATRKQARADSERLRRALPILEHVATETYSLTGADMTGGVPIGEGTHVMVPTGTWHRLQGALAVLLGLDTPQDGAGTETT